VTGSTMTCRKKAEVIFSLVLTFLSAFFGAYIGDQYSNRPIIQVSIDPQFYVLEDPERTP